jgi:asparagine synthase (glutamine-hydrolysing)
MCGIFGVLNPTSAGIDRSAARQCLDLLEHRGPDDHGWYEDADVALGHRRLTIMDLSATGVQPMSNEDETVWITFNGEIYDFWKLRDELEALGHRFRSTSDTEVIVHGYEEWGLEVLDRIDGMFAFGLWDQRTRTLLLARDRLGKKPLFVARKGDTIAFSSQLRPLIASGIARPVIRPDSLREYLFLNYVVGPKTIFEDIELLPPGSWLRATEAGVETGRYWDLRTVAPDRSGDQQGRFERMLVEATHSRMVSDAPLGIFLSGGVDSAVIAAIAQQHREQAESTFSVGFESPSYDERPKARAVADLLGTHHHEIICRAEDVPTIMPHLARSADHLLADQSMIPLAKLAAETKKYVKVVLTGDGGDELLAGYQTYDALKVAAYYVRYLPRVLRGALSQLGDRLPTRSEKMSASMIAERFFKATTGDLAQAHASWRAIWAHDEIDALLGGRWPGGNEYADYAARVELRPDWSLLRSAVHADITTWLVDSILAKVDRATMGAGLEARSPLLDSRLVEFAFATLLTDEKRNAGKRPLRRFATTLLGPEHAGEKKEGFQTPFASWFGGPLRGYVREQIVALGKRLPGVFDGDVMERVEAEHAAGTRNHGLKLWSLVALSEWAALFPELRLAEPR